MRVEFELSMPARGSWDGGWSGEDRQYLLYCEVSAKLCAELCVRDEPSWTYAFGDGWVAGVTARPAKRKRRSDGFIGYDWMVSSILSHGEIRS